ncbi:MltA domain-containing protein [Limibaculum sp. M0105]|uniref:peptidoglycan lytic exotransglycosylase n=1 Tax=Thermohalobaculum xanthum TaxID=2753746 RepID=A0A8J7SG17_9RHOB|nr:MltA domain-containing protein [Thermohalobaculum xanthum]MBK0400516.1 MltA domain-containing protein [Thermohalobaculum xanthum]
MSARAETWLDFSDLRGWDDDAHDAALAVWLRSNPPDLARTLAAPSPEDGPAVARRWWQERFRPVLVGDPARARLTAYYEPVIPASDVPTARFTAPLLALPPESAWREPMPDRAAIVAGAFAGFGLELFWLEDAVELYFLQIQGSGRLKLPDGRLVRIGYAGRNGHDYASIGRIMMAEGHMPEGGASAGRIKKWLRADPDRGARMMARNPSYVFFREIANLRDDEGPIGAMGLPLSAHRSLAIDTRHHPFGSAIWVEANGLTPRLMVAMDRGTAIRGPQRGDIFFGTGEAAGNEAGRVSARGRLLRLVPVESDA